MLVLTGFNSNPGSLIDMLLHASHYGVLPIYPLSIMVMEATLVFLIPSLSLLRASDTLIKWRTFSLVFLYTNASLCLLSFLVFFCYQLFIF